MIQKAKIKINKKVKHPPSTKSRATSTRDSLSLGFGPTRSQYYRLNSSYTLSLPYPYHTSDDDDDGNDNDIGDGGRNKRLWED